MKTGILLIAHGSRNPDANQDLHYMAARLRERGSPIVTASYLELCEPDIDTGAGICVAQGAGQVVLVPYFLSAGIHVRRDLTEACARLRARHPGVGFVLAEPLGRHELLLDILTERIGEALSP